MRTNIVIAAICSAAIGLAEPASASQEQTNTVAKEKQAQQQKKICKWLPATGSNRVEKHCLTAEDWKKAEALAW